jgi:hypothetical protein
VCEENQTSEHVIYGDMPQPWLYGPAPCALCHKDIKKNQLYREAGAEFLEKHRERIVNHGAENCHAPCYKGVRSNGKDKAYGSRSTACSRRSC